MAPIRARVFIHFSFTSDPKLICNSVLKVVLVPFGTIDAKCVVLQHHYHGDADSYAPLAAHLKIASILSSSFSPHQVISSPVTAKAGHPGFSPHYLQSSPLTYFLDGKAFFCRPARIPSHEKKFPQGLI